MARKNVINGRNDDSRRPNTRTGIQDFDLRGSVLYAHGPAYLLDLTGLLRPERPALCWIIRLLLCGLWIRARRTNLKAEIRCGVQR